MILRTLELKQFGKFAEAAFEFRRGLNLVVGPNEAGKSTLMEAVPAVLFGLRNKDRFKPWGRQGASSAALVLESRGRTVRVKRDLLTDRVTLVERDDLYHVLYSFEGKAAPQGRSSERAEYLEQLSRILGIAEEDVFRASLFFGQGSLELSGQGALAAKLKTLLSGFVEVDYDKVLHSLTEDYFAITRENPWGKDKTRGRELDDVRSRLADVEARWFDSQEKMKELAVLREQLEALKAGIESDGVEYAKGEKYLSWVRKQWHLGEKEESLRRDFNRVNRQVGKISELQQERSRLAEEMKKTGLPADIPEDLPLILSEAEKIRKELIGVQGESAALRQKLLAQRGAPWRPAGGASLALAALAAVLGWIWSERLVQILMGAGLLLAPVWGWFLWRLGLCRSERSRLQGQAQVLERQREEAQGRLAALDERFERIGLSPSAVEIVRMQKNLERHRQLADKLREIDSALKVLEDSAELGREKENLTRELAVLDERLEQQRPLHRDGLLTPEELPEAEEKLRALGESLRLREAELLEMTRREASLQGELSRTQELEEEGERLKERESVLARRKEALALGRDLLSGAVHEFRRTYLGRFAADVGRNLALVTGGRHAEARLGEDMSVSLRGKGNSWQPVEHFSRGTIDALYFALRLSLTRHLSPGRHLPLLLDDPLVNLDRFRLAETLKMLELLSREHQAVLFAHDENLLRRAARDRWHVVSLEETKPLQPSTDQERSEDVGQLYLL
jgi:DNA repair exonuclease SbcCD ATPase subunit